MRHAAESAVSCAVLLSEASTTGDAPSAQTVSAVVEEAVRRQMSSMAPAAAAVAEVEVELHRERLRRCGLPHGGLLLSGVSKGNVLFVI